MIQFPALEINSSRGFICCNKDEEALTQCYALYLRDGYYDDLQILDSQGLRLKVIYVEKVTILKRFAIWPQVFQRKARIKLDFGKGEQLTLQQGKDFLFSVIEQHASLWDEMEDLDQIWKLIRQVDDFTGLINLFGETFRCLKDR
jgi:hypothetical protein